MSAEIEPFDLLVQLAEHVQALKPELPAQRKIQTSWSGIGFSILGQRMIAPLGEVVEMFPVPSVTRLPGVQDWVLGLANVRGRLMPLFDLEFFFGGQALSVSQTNKKKRRVLVLELGDLYAGLVVNEVYGMQHFPEDASIEPVPTEQQYLAPYSQGIHHQDGIVWMTFSPFSLVRDPRFFNAAAA
ncbi:Uncharacterised protein [BD1-7 clade bacterium]|uniref:CheW-like domain-containing protein n=1 Tax=BD1-7 clade bacterium TaxID=2029982 RepID=A0A5S9N5K6_9GAMM|nr:Uncharacterised protein [BD1-7 clade bacterium]CAA0084207.1 Uncharacterised protein [BD1-7 clade bacterium]